MYIRVYNNCMYMHTYICVIEFEKPSYCHILHSVCLSSITTYIADASSINNIITLFIDINMRNIYSNKRI